MFCEKCGAKNDSSSNFCEKCGAKLDKEVKETKKTTSKKTNSKKSEPVIEKKTSSLSKKQKLIGGIVLAVIVVCFAVYKIGEKLTGIESVASKAFEQLSSKKTIDKKYLSVSLDSDGYFVSLEDQIEKVLDDKDIALKYSDYEVKSDDDTAVIVYRDKEDKEKYKIVFEFEKDGKTMIFFDRYIINKITIKKDYDEDVIYDPSNTKKLTLKTVKDAKVSIDGKTISKSYLDKKKSDKDKDVYVIKGVSKGEYKVEFALGKLEFERKINVYSTGDNEYDLSSYISSSYLKDDNSNFAKEFKKYIEKYYEYANDESKTIDDFAKDYKVTDDIKTTFNKSKESTYYTSIKIGDVKMNSLYYDSSDKELTISYKVEYKYTTESTEAERDSYSYVRATYDINNLELPTSLSYLPY